MMVNLFIINYFQKIYIKNMNLTNFFDVFKTLYNFNFENLGVLYTSLYHNFPIEYRIFFDNKDKLTYIKQSDYFSDIKKQLKSHIDSRKFIDNCIKLSMENHIYVMNPTGNEYLIFGKRLEFLININISHVDRNESLESMCVFCEPDKINEIVDFLSDYICVSNPDNTYEFGIATCNGSSLYTAYYDYKIKHDIDIDKNYNDDFKKPYEKICQIIETPNETGLMLLYGEPGTGKSSIIKNLIMQYPDINFIFLDDSIIGGVQQSQLISYFIENQNVVFILEDCEKILMSRDKGYNPIINTLLNITDGIIGDVLGIKLICTFNTKLENIDKALLRKGRLSLKYEFKKLDKTKVSKIINREVNEDMSLADIYNIDDVNDFSKEQERRKVGF